MIPKLIENASFTGQFDDGRGVFCDLHLRQCRFFNCGLSMTHAPQRRSRVERVIIEDCNVRGCSIGSAIVEDSVVRNLRSAELLRFEGTIFKHVTFEGAFDDVTIVPPMPLLSETERDVAAIRADSIAYYQHVDWAIDIGRADFRCFDIAGIPARLIRRDSTTSCVIRREKLIDGRWRSLDLSSTYWSVNIEDLLDSEDDDCVLAAGRRDPDFSALVAGINLLRNAQIAEPD